MVKKYYKVILEPQDFRSYSKCFSGLGPLVGFWNLPDLKRLME